MPLHDEIIKLIPKLSEESQFRLFKKPEYS